MTAETSSESSTEVETLRRRVAELEASERRYRTMFEEAGDAIFVADLETKRFVEVNRRAVEMLGYTRQELLELGPSDIATKKDAALPFEVLEPLERTGSAPFRRAVKHKKGNKIALQGTATMLSLGHTKLVMSTARVLPRDDAWDLLRDSERRLRQIIDGLFGFVGLCTVDGVLIEANRAPLEAAGIRAEDVLGKPFWDTYWWSYDPAVQARLRGVMARAAAGERVRYEERVRVLGDTMIDLDLSFGPMLSANGAINGIVGFGVDITDRTRTTLALQENEERLRLAVEVSGLGTWELNFATMKVTCDARHAAILGFGARAFRSHDEAAWAAMVHPRDREEVRSRFHAYVTGDAPAYQAEMRLRTSTGGWKWVRSGGKIVERDAHGAPLRLIGTVSDVDERRRAVDDLRSTRDQLHTTLHALPDLLFELDADGRVRLAHAPSAELFQVPAGHSSGRTIRDMLPKHAADIIMTALAKTLVAGRVTGIVYSLKTPRGLVWLEATMARIGEKASANPGVIMLVRHVTKRVQSEEGLREQAKMQEVLVQEINHRVRNNLAAILGMLGAERAWARVGERETSAVLDDLEQRIRAVATAHDILSENLWKAFPLSTLCERVVHAIANGRLDDGAKTEIRVTRSPQLVCSRDANHLALVLAELTTNALKYGRSQHGDLKIRVEVTGDDSRLVLRFRDYGAGYPEAIITGDRAQEHLGLELIEGIVHHSLQGGLELSSHDGAVATISMTATTMRGSESNA